MNRPLKEASVKSVQLWVKMIGGSFRQRSTRAAARVHALRVT